MDKIVPFVQGTFDFMQCFIYKSSKQDELYLYVDKKDDFSSLPDLLINRIGKPVFVMELELTPNRKLAREDTKKVIEHLRERGFFVQMPPLKIPAPEILQ